MYLALIRRTDITHLDGVNRFIALLAKGLAKVGHEPVMLSWCYNGVKTTRKWFKEMHGLDMLIPVRTLRNDPCEGDFWIRIAAHWFFKGSKILYEEKYDAAIVNGVVPLRYKPKIADLPLVKSIRDLKILRKNMVLKLNTCPTPSQTTILLPERLIPASSGRSLG